MKPILFQIGEFILPAYTLLVTAAILAGTWLGVRQVRRLGLPVIYALDMAIIGIVAGFAGGRIAHVLVERPDYYLENPLRVFFVWEGGFVSWGGYIAIFLSWYFYLRWRRQPVWAYFDCAAFAAPAALAVGRAACLLQGCCFGKPTDFIFHLTFTDPASTAYHFYPNVPLHATQAYLMLNGLVLMGILWWTARRWWRFQGQLFSLLLILYAVGRFLIEFLRGDTERGVYFDGLISSGQITMVCFFLMGMGLFFYHQRKGLPLPNA